MKENTFNIYVMSYKRPDCILSQNCFEYCTYVVREEEAEEYRKNGVKNILPIPKGAVNDFMSTLYWIIENTPEQVIFVADDDIKGFMYRMKDTIHLEDKNGNPDKEKITSEIERIAQIIYDINIGLAFDEPFAAPYGYDRDFQFKGMPGHIRWINKKSLKAKYNKDDEATSDIDMCYQELLMNRVVLQSKYFLSNAFMDTNKGEGGKRKEHYAMIEAMKNKWGRYYDYNFKRNIAVIDIKR